MELEKGKYKKSEVMEMLTEQSLEYEFEIINLKNKIKELKAEIKDCKSEIKELKSSVPPKKTVAVTIAPSVKNTKKTSAKDKFNPKSKIKDYIKRSSNGGIDLKEAMSVDDSQLGAICKDLGLTGGK